MDTKASFFKRRSDSEAPKQNRDGGDSWGDREPRPEREFRSEPRAEREFSSEPRPEREFRSEPRPEREFRSEPREERAPRAEREPGGEREFVTRPRFNDDNGPSFGDRPRYESRGGGERGGGFRGDRRDDRRDDRAPRGDRGDRRDDRGGERGGERKFDKKPFSPIPALKIPDNLIFGVHPVREAFQADRSIEKIYTVKRGNETLQEIEQMAIDAGVPVQYVPTEKLDYLSKKNNHQGIVAILSEIQYAEITEIMDKNPTLLLVLDSITDVRNFGAIARSAECAGVEAIIVSAKNSAPINGEAMKSSAGALNRIPVCKVGSLRNTMKTIQLSGFQLVAATEKGGNSLYMIDFKLPTVIVMGSEEKGISNDTLKLCDTMASISMKGNIESLNVSAAAAVMLYEAVRQRQ